MEKTSPGGFFCFTTSLGSLLQAITFNTAYAPLVVVAENKNSGRSYEQNVSIVFFEAMPFSDDLLRKGYNAYLRIKVREESTEKIREMQAYQRIDPSAQFDCCICIAEEEIEDVTIA